MCGFLFAYDRNGLNPAGFADALDLLNHRGPDDEGFAYMGHASGSMKPVERGTFKTLSIPPRMAMGHKRLSIVDLTSGSRQPRVSRDGKTSLVFNGEIYNFRDLSRSAETANSDTLTLFEYLNQGGIDGLEKLNGMWAFCYHDAESRKLYVSRDRYGKKPVYYYQDTDRLIVASEMKSIFALLPPEKRKRQITSEGLTYYLLGKQTPFLNDGGSFYQGIHTVRPGQTMVFDLDLMTSAHYAQNHFDYFGKPDFKGISDKAFFSMLEEDITAAIHTRLKGEVPVTILASGGVDSSWIAGVASQGLKEYGNLSLYTCHIMDGADQPNEDLTFARRLARELNLDLKEIRVDPLQSDAFFDLCKTMTRQVELPLNLFLSTIPTYLMTSDMREQGIKVVLDGVGGDEIMGGYPAYESLFHAALNRKDFAAAVRYFNAWRQFQPQPSNEIRRILKSGVKSIFTDSGIRSTPDQMEDVFKNLVARGDLPDHFSSYAKGFTREKMSRLTERQLFEINHYQLPYYLGIADQMSMVNSVENRSPYLDARLHKYIYAPDRFKFRGGYNKFALRKTMPANISNDIRWRKGKIGIGNAYSQTLMDSPYVRERIMDSPFIRSAFEADKLPSALQGPGARNTARPLFSLALLDEVCGLALPMI